MTAGVILLVGGLVFLSGSALAAFYWSVKTGQLNNLAEGAKSIFDEDEPVGVSTDKFPSKTRS
ncbi:MAG: cbb3-type cytochrome oxidase assembly protein CcoS [Terrimicrobiaceae bacterium]|nr:cbb3-type cytochrome oxidase assembly protein CcoS [Terrimicrobiaceae bacterium]